MQGADADKRASLDMLDAELRLLVASAYYRRRREGQIQLRATDVKAQLRLEEIDRISVQLIELGLLSASRLDKLLGTTEGFRARLTANGVDLVEAELRTRVETKAPPLALHSANAQSFWRDRFSVSTATVGVCVLWAWACNQFSSRHTGTFEWAHFAETLGSILVFIGAAATAYGVILTTSENSRLDALNANGQLVAELFRKASKWATLGLVVLAAGGGVLIIKSMLPPAEVQRSSAGEVANPSAQTANQPADDDSCRELEPLLIEQCREPLPPFLHFDPPTALPASSPTSTGGSKPAAAGRRAPFPNPPSISASGA